MLTALRHADRHLAATRRGWLWLGQIALVVLGIHLAADRLDDHLLLLLQRVPGAGDVAPALATWSAVALELGVAARATWMLVSSFGGPEPAWEDWWARRSVEAFVRPAFWAVTALAGAWGVAMAVEDALAPIHPWLGTLCAAGTAVLVAWRLGWTGWTRVVGGLFVPRRRTLGLLWAPPVVLVTALALLEALPVWGWLP